MNRSKVPDSANTAFNEQITYLLRARCGDGDDAYMHIHFAAEAAELGYRKYRLTLEFGRLFAEIERGDYIEPVSLETAVVEQRLAEAAGADYHGVIDIIIAEESFKLRDKILDIVADLRFAGRADAREILANLNIIELKRFGDSCSGYIFRCILRKPLDIAQVHRQSLKSVFRDIRSHKNFTNLKIILVLQLLYHIFSDSSSKLRGKKSGEPPESDSPSHLPFEQDFSFYSQS